MPVYKCPRCGRTVVLPEGTYYCKVCGPNAKLTKVSKTSEKSCLNCVYCEKWPDVRVTLTRNLEKYELAEYDLWVCVYEKEPMILSVTYPNKEWMKFLAERCPWYKKEV